jgi:hypothetical protein
MRRHPQAKLDGRAMLAGQGPQTRVSRRGTLKGKGTRGVNRAAPRAFVPPERWHEPAEKRAGYRFIVEPAGEGYRHIVTPDEVRARLAQLPAWMTERLEIVQLSRMTRKKKTFPCYGMQWGATIYLYPIEAVLEEHFHRPPTPAQYHEARLYGGRWVQSGADWTLHWTLAALQDFYLNNILIHELGHLVDERNSSYIDRERYAEWFAIEYGYRPTQRERLAQRAVEKLARLAGA